MTRALLLSQEVFDLIIDAGASNRDSLRIYALVSKSWYRRAAHHIWKRVKVRGDRPKRVQKLFDILTDNLSLLGNIEGVELRGMEDSLEFVALCLFLAPVPSLRIDVEVGEQFLYGYFRGDDHPCSRFIWEREPLAMALRALYHSDMLTTLHCHGYCFPTGLLQYVPNLRDLSISKEEMSLHRLRLNDPGLFGLPIDELGPPLSFRLRRAHFSNVDEIFAGLVTQAPQIFLELEEYELGGQIGSRFQEPGNSEASTAKVLSLARSTIRSVTIRDGCLFKCTTNCR